MSLGLVTLLIAVAGAGWLLLRVSRGGVAGEARNVTLLKAVVLLGLIAALFAVKLWPLAFMVLVGAGGVMAIELWRGREIDDAERKTPAPIANRAMTSDEAASVLGLSVDADADAVRAAHRKLIAQTHPDKGGTDYLASKINEARDLLLRRLGEE